MEDLKKMEDPDNELSTDTDADLSSDESVIETMENHRRSESGKVECEMLCSSGTKQWALEDLVEKDVPELVEECKKKFFGSQWGRNGPCNSHIPE